MSESADDVHLVSFGPTRPVPEGHRWCMACDGSGEDSLEDDCPCEICKGKGHWNEDDINDYHAKYPEVCLSSCGDTHRPPYLGPPRDTSELKSLIEEARKLLGEHKIDS